MQIGGRRVGGGQPCFVIAEAGVNHNGDLALARELVRVAARAGADAVKFQTFRAAQLATADAPKAGYQKAATAPEETQQEMLRKLELSDAAHHELKALCAEHGIMFMSSPFDESCADFLHALGVDALKVPSGEITNTPYLTHLARLGVPLILSTGMATLEEVRAAVAAVARGGPVSLALLHCVSNYPAAPAGCNLRAMATMQREFGVPVGFSDHTLGIEVALAAVALGACVVEKHFTLDRSMPGPDHPASLDPAQLAEFVGAIRRVESALGDGIKAPLPSEAETAAVARKSVVAACDIAVGTKIRAEMLVCRRPGTGMPPSRLEELVGRSARVAIAAGSLLREDLVS
ncbi:MAG: N-acetylneuraminate synthase [Opitutae bacterium]|nr:N-acetylneuraminate synthase [Opitutae bacterium]